MRQPIQSASKREETIMKFVFVATRNQTASPDAFTPEILQAET